MVKGWEDLRPEVQAFALSMEEELRANDFKGGWKGCDPQVLTDRLFQEAEELDMLLETARFTNVPSFYIALRKEAADVANFAMMVSDVAGGLNESLV